MTRPARIALALSTALALGFAAELAKEIATSLTRYGATIGQAVTAAVYWMTTRSGLVNVALWAALLFGIGAAMVAIGRARGAQPRT